MSIGRALLRNIACLAALCTVSMGQAVAAPSAPSKPTSWQADPDEQFILDVQIHQLRLGDTVRAYNAPEGTCVVLGDFLTALDLPIRIDLARRIASGWAFKENNKIVLDYGAARASFGQNRTEAIQPG